MNLIDRVLPERITESVFTSVPSPRSRRPWILLLILLLTADCLAEENARQYRHWTTASGQRSGVKLKIVEQDATTVRLQREDNNKVVLFSIDMLSDTDQQFLASLTWLPGTATSASGGGGSDDLPRFRADHGSSKEIGLPTDWSDSQNLKWKTALPGSGSSTPIFIGDRIYLTCYSGYGLSKESPGDKANLQRHLVCLARDDGRIIWDKKFPALQSQHDYQGFVALHGFASSTPASDGKRVYCLFGRSGVYGFDAASGEVLWNTDVGQRLGGFGTSGSLVVHENLVIVNASSESGEMVALNATTGKKVWQVDGVKEFYGSPVLVNAGERTEVVIDTESKLISVDANTGATALDLPRQHTAALCV